ncbi:MAG: Rnf-Nqr domain containing protein, partial [Oscillospiraceae bacterium]
NSLGIFLSLIVVNCIILGRAEAFASKNNVLASGLDGLGMGLGFTLALTVVGSIREILGKGTIFSFSIGQWFEPIQFFATPAGGFFVFGMLIALINVLTNYKMSNKKVGCSGCPSAKICQNKEQGECE